MAKTTDIKNRIKGVEDTKKITSAMYLIASNKMKRAKRELDNTRPYFIALREEIKRIFRTVYDVESKYFYPPRGETLINPKVGILVITADKGLAGGYNLNVLKETQGLLREYKNARLFMVGEYGRQYLKHHRISYEEDFNFTANNPSMHRARRITTKLLDLFDNRELDKLYIIYTDLKNQMSATVNTFRLLPFHRGDFVTDTVEKKVEQPFEFYPSVKDVLDSIMFSYISGFIYSALVDSYCSEQNERMTAMDASNRNAEKLLGDLFVQYNRVRQSTITQEITEVSAGEKAQKRKKAGSSL